MNRLVASTTAVLLGCASAQAADYPLYDQAYPMQEGAPPVWQGAYFGANVGWGTGKIEAEIPAVLRGSVDADGMAGGVHAGYNFLSGATIFGVEADVQLAGISGGWEPVPGAGLSGKLTWFSTLRGRAGFVLGDYLLYGTGGLAIGGGKATAYLGGFSESRSKTHVGWTLGFGTEMALNHELSVRLEYLYADFGKKNYLSGVNIDSRAGLRAHLFRIGATAHF